jgi:prolyl-tRNA editing enzyme YbaK/EbsC (Cys-tRNA(Pro) deacylase)
MTSDASDIERRVAETLKAAGVEYEKITCDPELADTALFCERYGVALEDSANAILVTSKKPPPQYALCLVLATTRLDVNHAVRDLMGVKRLSFASPEETVSTTGMLVGGVTPFGVSADLPVYVDARVMTRPSIVIGGGSRSSKIRLAPSALAKLPNVRVVEGLATEPRAQ